MNKCLDSVVSLKIPDFFYFMLGKKFHKLYFSMPFFCLFPFSSLPSLLFSFLPALVHSLSFPLTLNIGADDHGTRSENGPLARWLVHSRAQLSHSGLCQLPADPGLACTTQHGAPRSRWQSVHWRGNLSDHPKNQKPYCTRKARGWKHDY